MASRQERAVVAHRIRTAAATLPWFARTTCLDLDGLTPLQRRVLAEKRLISPCMTAQGTQRLAMVHDAGHFSILINEEDHLRIQAIHPGFHLQKAWRIANTLERSLTEKLDFAYSDHEGYVTSCASNRGAGIRASVMVFVPGLRRSKRLIPFLGQMSDSGCTIRGMYGEGSGTHGDVLQISTQIPPGDNEAEHLRTFEERCESLLQEEWCTRLRMLQSSPDVLNSLRPIYTTGRNVTFLALRPALRIWAALRFETVLYLERSRLIRRSREYRRYARRLCRLDRLFVQIQPAHLRQALDASRTTPSGIRPDDEDRRRAQLLQAELELTPWLREAPPVKGRSRYV